MKKKKNKEKKTILNYFAIETNYITIRETLHKYIH
jgi:hypothetical protein